MMKKKTFSVVEILGFWPKGMRLEEIVERMSLSSKDAIRQPTNCLQEKAAREWSWQPSCDFGL